MQCYSMMIDLDEIIPSTTNEKGRKIYDDGVINTIQMGYDELNRKYFGEFCAFVYKTLPKALYFGIIIMDNSCLKDRISELTKNCKLSGKTSIDEITFSQFVGYARSVRKGYGFEFDYYEFLDPYDLYVFTGFHNVFTGIHNKASIEKICKSYTIADLKERLASYLYDEVFIPELERIATPPVKKCAHGHPVHYIIRSNDPLDICDRLISQLYEYKRVRSKHYLIYDEDTIRDSDLETIFSRAANSTVVIHLKKEMNTSSE